MTKDGKRAAQTGLGRTVVNLAALTGALLCALCAWSSAPASASGCTDTWTNTSGGSWSTAANWSKGTVPSSSGDVCITTNGTYTVTLDPTAGSPSVKTLTLGGTTGAQKLSVTSMCSGSEILGTTEGLTVKPRGKLSLTSSLCGLYVEVRGAVTNNGTITAEKGEGGERYFEGNLTNNGTVTIAGEKNELRGNVANKGPLTFSANTTVTGSTFT